MHNLVICIDNEHGFVASRDIPSYVTGGSRDERGDVEAWMKELFTQLFDEYLIIAVHNDNPIVKEHWNQGE